MKYYLRKLVKIIKKLHCKKVTEVIYDSEDNLVKIDSSPWSQSWDLEHNIPVNFYVAVRHDWTGKALNIVTPLASSITGVKVNGRLLPFTRTGNLIKVIYDDMHWYMDNSDIFYIDLKRH